MSLKTRRILFITFILIFLITTPLVISYATGYKFIFSKKIIQKTGILILDTNPRDAKIYLNEKPQQFFFKKYFKKTGGYITTPAKIKNLLPGKYNVKLELDGYWSWQKKLTIEPGISTFAEDINLFKKETPLLLKSGRIDQMSLSPDNKYLAAAIDEEISIIDTETGGSVPSSKLKSDPPNLISDSLLWPPDNKQAMIDGAIIKDGYSFSIIKTTNSATLNIREVSSKKITGSIDLPSSSSYSFINAKHNLINLYDKKHQILYLIDPFSYFPLKETINNVKYTAWVNSNKLLWANEFEIWLADFEYNKKTLLTRISSPLMKIIWHPSNNYVIYSTDKSINTIELDDREKRNITELIKLDKISSTYLSEKGDILYFYGEIGKQKGLYKLAI